MNLEEKEHDTLEVQSEQMEVQMEHPQAKKVEEKKKFNPQRFKKFLKQIPDEKK